MSDSDFLEKTIIEIQKEQNRQGQVQARQGVVIDQTAAQARATNGRVTKLEGLTKEMVKDIDKAMTTKEGTQIAKDIKSNTKQTSLSLQKKLELIIGSVFAILSALAFIGTKI